MAKSGDGSWRMSVNRLETLVDGIFAIAMTLLVFNIAVPPSSEITPDVKFFRVVKIPGASSGSVCLQFHAPGDFLV